MLRAIAIGLLFALCACSSVNPPAPRMPQMTFANLQALQLDVARVEIVSKYQPPAQAPHIEYDMPVSPENAIKRWVQDRLQPVGKSGTLRVTILDAQATDNPLKVDTGVKSLFEKQQVSRVDVSVEVLLQILDERQFPVAEASAKASRSRTMPEGLKLNERDSILYDLVEATMLEFNTNMDPYMRTSFARWTGVR